MRRLRIAGAGLDPVASRLRAERAFASLDLPALGLPPSAVLCIRTLADPRPRSCRFGADGLRLTPAWRDALRSEIERKARGAPRPARERVAASADCVLFADTSELLAAAAEDWLAHGAHSRWWWKSLLGAAASGGRALPGLWPREPEHVPGALEHLAAKGKAAEFVRQLTPGEARGILRRVAAAFHLRGLDSTHTHDAESAPSSSRNASEFGVGQSDAWSPGRVGTPPPWHDLVPECAGAGLDAGGELLLGVGLSLSRAPGLARREDFARRAAAWAHHATRVDARAEDPKANGMHAPRALPAGTTAAHAREGAGRDSHDLDGPTTSASATRDEQTGRRSPRARDDDAPQHRDRSSEAGANNARRPASGVDDDKAAGDAARASSESAGVARSGESDDGKDAAEFVANTGTSESRAAEVDLVEETAEGLRVASSPSAPRVAPLLEAEIETRFGGLFHLVNLGLFLNLYGDFTTPAEPGLPLLPVWDFVALLGRRLAGARVERDPLWPLLARLAGRGEDDEPGARFSPHEDWRVPADWLKPFGAACVLRWSEAGGRLRVAHPAGFTVIDVTLDDESPTTTRAEAQLTHELRPYLAGGARLELRRVARLRGARGRTPRARWLDRVAAYAVARLSLALGARGAAGLSRILCERHARVFVTAAHVDVVMRLGELPVEVRFAGLDRDPGWVPAACRHVAFHFE